MYEALYSLIQGKATKTMPTFGGITRGNPSFRELFVEFQAQMSSSDVPDRTLGRFDNSSPLSPRRKKQNLCDIEVCIGLEDKRRNIHLCLCLLYNSCQERDVKARSPPAELGKLQIQPNFQPPSGSFPLTSGRRCEAVGFACSELTEGVCVCAWGIVCSLRGRGRHIVRDSTPAPSLSPLTA